MGHSPEFSEQNGVSAWLLECYTRNNIHEEIIIDMHPNNFILHLSISRNIRTASKQDKTKQNKKVKLWDQCKFI